MNVDVVVLGRLLQSQRNFKISNGWVARIA